MRLTINIPDDIDRSLKIKAAKEDTTMRALLLQGIDDHLKSKIITVPHDDHMQDDPQPKK
jgi:hypothetical protein